MTAAASGGLLVMMNTGRSAADADGGAHRTGELPPTTSKSIPTTAADLVGAARDGRRHEDVAADADRRGARRRLESRSCGRAARSEVWGTGRGRAMRSDRIGIGCDARSNRASLIDCGSCCGMDVPATECETGTHTVRHPATQREPATAAWQRERQRCKCRAMRH